MDRFLSVWFCVTVILTNCMHLSSFSCCFWLAIIVIVYPLNSVLYPVFNHKYINTSRHLRTNSAESGVKHQKINQSITVIYDCTCPMSEFLSEIILVVFVSLKKNNIEGRFFKRLLYLFETLGSAWFRILPMVKTNPLCWSLYVKLLKLF